MIEPNMQQFGPHLEVNPQRRSVTLGGKPLPAVQAYWKPEDAVAHVLVPLENGHLAHVMATRDETLHANLSGTVQWHGTSPDELRGALRSWSEFGGPEEKRRKVNENIVRNRVNNPSLHLGEQSG